MKKRVFYIALVIVSVCWSTVAQNRSNDTVLVLPFENTSKMSDFNWVGESIADSLTNLLKVPGLSVISNQYRKVVQQRLKIPPSVLPSLAASLKLAREAGASLMVSGTYNIIPKSNDAAVSVTVKARVILVIEGKLLGETLPDGRKIYREIELMDALGNLQTVQGKLAYEILLQHDNKGLAVSQDDRIELANKVPAKAFEAYIKGLLTSPSDTNARENFFRNAIRIYGENRSDETYVNAAMELGHLYLNNKKYQNAIDYFSKVPPKKSQFAEAAFYTGVINWRQKRYEQALAVLSPLAKKLKLTAVYNMLGTIATEASRAEKKNPGKSAEFLIKALEFFDSAPTLIPINDNLHFNHSFALFLDKNYKKASEKLRPILAGNPRDGEAYFLLAKILEKLGNPSSQYFDNQARRFLTEGNRYAALEEEWKKEAFDGIALRVTQPTRGELVSGILMKNRAADITAAPEDETASLLEKAQKNYDSGSDEAAQEILKRILVSEPMSAETHLLLGKIHLRRGDTDNAVSNFKTAYFWNNRLIESHILLGRIYIQKRDCLQAKNYSVSALAIDKENKEALALERQVVRCSK